MRTMITADMDQRITFAMCECLGIANKRIKKAHKNAVIVQSRSIRFRTIRKTIANLDRITSQRMSDTVFDGAWLLVIIHSHRLVATAQVLQPFSVRRLRKHKRRA